MSCGPQLRWDIQRLVIVKWDSTTLKAEKVLRLVGIAGYFGLKNLLVIIQGKIK